MSTVDLRHAPVIFVKPEFASRFAACVGGFFHGIKKAKVLLLAVWPNVSAPFLRALVVVNASNSAAVSAGPLHIASVHGTGNVSKVAPSVIGPASVDVVDFAYGVGPGHPLPDDTVSEVPSAIKSYSYVALNSNKRYRLSGMACVPTLALCFGALVFSRAKLTRLASSPRQNTRLGAVIKNLAQKTSVGYREHSPNDLLNRSFRLAGDCVSALLPASQNYHKNKGFVYVG